MILALILYMHCKETALTIAYGPWPGCFVILKAYIEIQNIGIILPRQHRGRKVVEEEQCAATKITRSFSEMIPFIDGFIHHARMKVL